jgi:single-stranded DNA-binding protein
MVARIGKPSVLKGTKGKAVVVLTLYATTRNVTRAISEQVMQFSNVRNQFGSSRLCGVLSL